MITRGEIVAEARAKCDSLGLHPLSDPLGDGHHTDVDFSAEDIAIGDALAYFLGTLFSDVDMRESSRYWYHERTSIDEWCRVARALRIHGLKIANHYLHAESTASSSPV